MNSFNSKLEKCLDISDVSKEEKKQRIKEKANTLIETASCMDMTVKEFEDALDELNISIIWARELAKKKAKF